MLEAAAEPILRARADLRRELAGLEKLVRRLAKEDRVCRLLMTMPGVGHVIALTYTSAIDDPERFRRSKDVGPWVGLTPGRDQSGERDIVGAITKAGDAGLRTALYQAATVMLSRGAPNLAEGVGAASGDAPRQEARDRCAGPADRRGASPDVAGRHRVPLHARGGDGSPEREPGEGHIRDRGSFSRPGRCCNRPTLNRSLGGTGNSRTTLGGYNLPQAPRLCERTIVSQRWSIEKWSLTGTAPLRKVGQDIDDVGRGELPPNPDRQALTGELVQDIERTKGPAVMGAVMHEVIGPDMVRPFGAQPDAGAVVDPEPPPLRLLAGTFSPSRRQIRSTRLSLTCQPASRSRAAIRR